MNYIDDLKKRAMVEEFGQGSRLEKNKFFGEQLRAFGKMNLNIEELYTLTGFTRRIWDRLVPQKDNPEYNLPKSTNDILEKFGFEEIDYNASIPITSKHYQTLIEATNSKHYLLEVLSTAKHTDIREISHLIQAINAGQQVMQDFAPFFPDVIHSIWNERELVLDIRYLIEEEHNGVYACDVRVTLPDWAQLTFRLEPIQLTYSSNKVPGSNEWCNEFWDDLLYAELLDQVRTLRQEIQKIADAHPENPFLKLNQELLDQLTYRIEMDEQLDRLEATELKETDTFLLALLLGFLLLDGRDNEALLARKDKFLAKKLCAEYGLTDIEH